MKIFLIITYLVFILMAVDALQDERKKTDYSAYDTLVTVKIIEKNHRDSLLVKYQKRIYSVEMPIRRTRGGYDQYEFVPHAKIDVYYNSKLDQISFGRSAPDIVRLVLWFLIVFFSLALLFLLINSITSYKTKKTKWSRRQ